MQTEEITISRAAHTGQSEEVSASIGDTLHANADLQAQLAASYESIALLEQELSDLKDAVRAYLSAPISRRGASWVRLKELTKDEL